MIAIACLAGAALGDDGGGEGARCGGDIHVSTCRPGLVCDNRMPGCSPGPMLGICTSVPKNCPKAEDAECGCNGKTYRNGCERLKARIAFAHRGTCDRN